MFLQAYTGQITFTNLSSQDVIPSEKEETQDGYSQGERKSLQDPEGLSASAPHLLVLLRLTCALLNLSTA